MNKRFGKNDVIFIALMAIFCVAVCVWVYKGGAVEGSSIVITIDGVEYGTYSLLEEQTIIIEENGNTNIVEIKAGKAYMQKASCPDHLCVQQNAICYDKESIICLPNKVVVTVISDIESDLDGIIR